MSSEHLTYLREVLEHDAIGFGEFYQLPDAIEHFEALEHASGQYRKAMSEQAKRIEQLEAALRMIVEMTPDPEFGALPIESAIDVARAALAGGKT